MSQWGRKKLQVAQYVKSSPGAMRLCLGSCCASSRLQEALTFSLVVPRWGRIMVLKVRNIWFLILATDITCDHRQIIQSSSILVHPYAGDSMFPCLPRAATGPGSSILSFHWPRKFLTISAKWVFFLYGLLRGKSKGRKQRYKAVLKRKCPSLKKWESIQVPHISTAAKWSLEQLVCWWLELHWV